MRRLFSAFLGASPLPGPAIDQEDNVVSSSSLDLPPDHLSAHHIDQSNDERDANHVQESMQSNQHPNLGQDVDNDHGLGENNDLDRRLNEINAALDSMSAPVVDTRDSSPQVSISASSSPFHIAITLHINNRRMLPPSICMFGPFCSDISSLLTQVGEVGIFYRHLVAGTRSCELGYLELETAPGSGKTFLTYCEEIYNSWFKRNSSYASTQPDKHDIPTLQVDVHLYTIEETESGERGDAESVVAPADLSSTAVTNQPQIQHESVFWGRPEDMTLIGTENEGLFQRHPLFQRNSLFQSQI